MTAAKTLSSCSLSTCRKIQPLTWKTLITSTPPGRSCLPYGRTVSSELASSAFQCCRGQATSRKALCWRSLLARAPPLWLQSRCGEVQYRAGRPGCCPRRLDCGSGGPQIRAFCLQSDGGVNGGSLLLPSIRLVVVFDECCHFLPGGIRVKGLRQQMIMMILIILSAGHEPRPGDAKY